MARSSDSRKVREWEHRMARFERGKLPVARFCQNEGVSVASFYQWRQKFQQAIPASKEENETPAFTPVRLVGSASLTVRLPGGTQLDVPTADPQVLQLAIQTLAQVDAQRIAGGAPC